MNKFIPDLSKLKPLDSNYYNLLKHKKQDISLEELISYIKIEEANRVKDKTLGTSSEFHLKPNIVKSSFGLKFNKLEGTKNLKNAKLKKKKAANNS
ncbi:hypothetical protein J1N35_044475 [Gossypium stocksii]|uniref:Uncharacterized protein n=1 Tax=Gossypium stocksii TaxID=47602 RepID=A0A9D3ZG49_9ROSI|nr:hypothetical protein J1N35_044475 [Gossypium stocksii]